MKLALAALLLIAACGSKAEENAAKRALAKRVAETIASEYYPQWVAAHPSAGPCPKLAELVEYVDRGLTLVDPWGQDFVVRCGADLPAAVHAGIGVVSKGPDRELDTSDDVHSW